MSKNEYKSRVYTDRPEYAGYDAPRKFQAIQGIVAKRLLEHPNAICSYSGGSDSDILMDVIERARKLFDLPPVKYAFFNTGLEMEATKRHVREQAQKYGVEITEYRPKVNIVQATRKYGVPLFTKIVSERLEEWQRVKIPFSIIDEFNAMTDEEAHEAIEEYIRNHGHMTLLLWMISRFRVNGMKKDNQSTLNHISYGKEFFRDHPPDFKVSAKCCEYCKKRVAHELLKTVDMMITGERKAEGGTRSMSWTKSNEAGCFREQNDGTYRLRPLYYVSDTDKAWYKEYYGIRYSDAYEVYGLTRTGCCGCPISYKAAEDLERIRPYEPWVVKAAWNIFGKSYEYRAAYNAYKKSRRLEEAKRGTIPMFENEEDT